jgi:hypothetical protein
MERFLLFIGFLGALATGAAAPLNILLFGDLTGQLVTYGMDIKNGTAPDTDAFTDAIQWFASMNSLLGLAVLLLTYVSIWTYNYVANKQVTIS